MDSLYAVNGRFVAQPSQLPRSLNSQPIEDVVYSSSSDPDLGSDHGLDLLNIRVPRSNKTAQHFDTSLDQPVSPWIVEMESQVNAWPEIVESHSYGMLNEGVDLEVAPSLGMELFSREFTYTNLFFSAFCTTRSILLKRDEWRPIIASHMHANLGVHNGVLAVAAMYAHRAQSIQLAGTDSLRFYRDGVSSVQSDLNSEINNLGCPSDSTLIGITMLMVYEMMTGNLTGLHAHMSALTSIVKQAGPGRCEVGLYKILFMTVMTPALLMSIQKGTDCFLADEEWLNLMPRLQMPIAARLTVLYMQAVRVLHHKRSEVRLDTSQAQANLTKASFLLEELRAVYSRIIGSGQMIEVWSTLHESPFQPSLTFENEFIRSGFPFMLAMILTLETAFGIGNSSQFTLIRQLVQVSQLVVSKSTNSADLLHQVWPLEVARSLCHTESDRVWIKQCQCTIHQKGFGLAIARH